MTNDLDLEALLKAAEALLPQQSKTDYGYQPVQYEQRQTKVHCTTCNKTYTGSMTCVVGMDNLYENYQTKWCPKCIANQAEFWWSQCFRLTNVKEGL